MVNVYLIEMMLSKFLLSLSLLSLSPGFELIIILSEESLLYFVLYIHPLSS